MNIYPLRIGFLSSICLVTIMFWIIYGIFSQTPLMRSTELWGQVPIEVKIVMNANNPYNCKYFEPNNLKIEKGTTVQWTNDDSSFHTVTSGSYDSGPTTGPEGFDSKLLVTGDSFQKQFNSIGTFNYFCTLHPFMTGQIVVH